MTAVLVNSCLQNVTAGLEETGKKLESSAAVIRLKKMVPPESLSAWQEEKSTK